MPKKTNILEGELPQYLSTQIYLNIAHLKKGEYLLKIVDNNKVVETITFKKK
ncbi:hypothetical protein ULMA_00810 [Patiriisocius marinus]|uniref:Secretion system C-terminal sorting domain-containing protein n=1 Tax=Patiriisocius marinus TaxID=1397112 RepID=A0A5J4IX05_9FLAO|nr:hypothetical protein ULMA_00810 [Patiriisocius marinus]